MLINIAVYPNESKPAGASAIALNNDVAGISIQAASIEDAQELFKWALPEAIKAAGNWAPTTGAAADAAPEGVQEGDYQTLDRKDRMIAYDNSEEGQRLHKRIATAEKFLEKNADKIDLSVSDGLYLADGVLEKEPYQFISWTYALGVKAGYNFAKREAKK